ncbi:TetR family transcriptional regulator [Methylobacterium sp. NEAU 140]|uniref:TetR/AcrR family transcriptional regulator n=1 Tax=Methylobacterium sp. NEAU 140 TaxID=3064945 RepID=UPI002732CCB2|nr:TetR family transcriptional regulator [Methylobacterium sp. NEAU 140]MDP4024202.1 TetR family transcriptional regulator [Methylobacterium sp. NEAU 140]
MFPDDPALPLAEETAPTTRCRIIATATEHFREIGYQKTTVADIARALKMSPANVYRFFDSKKAINEAVLERLIGEVEALVAGIADRPGLSATARLVAAIEALHDDSLRRLEEFPRVHEMIEAAMGESWEVCRHHVARITAVFERIVSDGVACGEFFTNDPALAAGCLHAGIARYTHPLLVSQPTLPPVPPLPAMIAFLLRGLAPESGSKAEPGMVR